MLQTADVPAATAWRAAAAGLAGDAKRWALAVRGERDDGNERTLAFAKAVRDLHYAGLVASKKGRFSAVTTGPFGRRTHDLLHSTLAGASRVAVVALPRSTLGDRHEGSRRGNAVDATRRDYRRRLAPDADVTPWVPATSDPFMPFF